MPHERVMLSVNRTGTFRAMSCQFTKGQCGNERERQYSFEVRVEATNESLSPHGFVVDNQVLYEYFRRRYEEERVPVRSCEDVAQDAVDHFLGWFASGPKWRQRVKLRRIVVTVHGHTSSWITAEWTSRPE